jgi:hypothetical protein
VAKSIKTGGARRDNPRPSGTHEKSRDFRRLREFLPGAILFDAPGAAPSRCGGAMTREEERELNLELERLKQEHRDLDSAIDALLGTVGHDRIQVQRLKKRKLQLRDRMIAIEDQLFPDIIA